MNIHIQLADMNYIDSCIEILQNSDLGKAYFSNHEKAADMLTYAVDKKTYMLHWIEMRNVWVLFTT